MNIFQGIKSKAKKRGMTVSDLCRKADVNRQTFQGWDKKTPSAITDYLAIMEVLDSTPEDEAPISEKIQTCMVILREVDQTLQGK